MGQFDNVNQAAADTSKLGLSGSQFHEMPGRSHGTASGGNGLDFSSLLNSGTDKAAAQPAQRTNNDAPPAIPSSPVARAQTDSLPVITTPVRRAAEIEPARPQQAARRNNDDDEVARPKAEESVGNQMGGLVTNLAVIGAGTLAARSLRNGVRAKEIGQVIDLAAVTKPESLEALRAQTDEVTRLIAGKSKQAALEVDKLVLNKPDAFQEMVELGPAKGPGQPNTQISFYQPKEPRALTEQELLLSEEQQALIRGNLTLNAEEMTIAHRAEYLRSLEKVMVKDFNMGSTSTVSAFRTRKPYIDGLGQTEAASAEGLAVPLTKLETMSNTVMEETTAGRLALHEAASKSIYRGAGMLIGSFAATRGIDRLLYGGKSQGFLTTAFDCAAPFVVLTGMSTTSKVATMVLGHEAVRAIEYFTEKNKDQ